MVGWGVGGIEAEACMLGQPISMLLPEVVGFKLTGTLARRRDRHRPGAHRHADAAQEGRGRQVRRVLWRPGVGALPLADRATIANMAPEYGATIGFFPIDHADARLSAADQSLAGTGRAGGSLRQGAGTVPHARRAGSGVLGHARARSCAPWFRRWRVPSARRIASIFRT